MELEDFLDCIRAGEIPPEPPDGLSSGGWEFAGSLQDADSWMQYSKARRECNERGMWAIVDGIWTRELADWIGSRRVLEIMAGHGWLAKALAMHGVRIAATDSGAWESQHQLSPAVFDIVPLTAQQAIQQFGDGAEVLLISWPPCGDAVIVQAAAAWGGTRPIIYIGEGEGGRNAPQRFFDRFVPSLDLDLPLKSWHGFHDSVLIGHYRSGSGS